MEFYFILNRKDHKLSSSIDLLKHLTMAKSKDIHDPNGVITYIEKLAPATAHLANAIREVILNTDPVIGEQIKWNAPSFFYNAPMPAFDAKAYKRDLIVFNFNKKDYILLVFPTGATINDDTGILEGNYTDGRRMVKINDTADLDNKAAVLQKVIRQWLAQTKQ